MTVSAIVVSRSNEAGLRSMLECLTGQTRPPDEILCYCAGYTSQRFLSLVTDHPGVEFHQHVDVPDFGHSARARGLAAASMEYVGFFNDDDWYEDTYLERMLAVMPGHDVVFCAWNEQPDCGFVGCQSTAGNFVSRRVLSVEAGWVASDRYENDAAHIDRLNELGARVVKVDDVLYHHNVGR